MPPKFPCTNDNQVRTFLHQSKQSTSISRPKGTPKSNTLATVSQYDIH